MTPVLVSGVAASLLAIFLVLARRTVFSWSLIGVFTLSSLVTVVIGVLAYPFLNLLAARLFAAFDLSMLSEQAMISAIVIQAGGLGLVVAVYIGSRLLLSRGASAAPKTLLTPGHFREDGASLIRVRVLLLACMAITGGYVLVNAPVFLNGVVNGMLARQPLVLLEARRAAVSNYVFVVLVYNVLPFLAAYAWIQGRVRKGVLPLFSGYVAVGWAAILLVLVFQKRPLIVFLLVLLTLWYWDVRSRDGHRTRSTAGKGKGGKIGVVLGAAVIFLVLVGLFETNTQIGTASGSRGDALINLSIAAVARIFGRIALPSLMYAEYFPSIAPHYGFSNVGLLSDLRNTPMVLDARMVYRHFSLVERDGSMAISAIGDFYGSFGWHGWFIGAALLGMLLSVGDELLRRLKPNRLSAVFIVFSMVTAFYLSQASVPRSLMGYGFAFFLVSWLSVRRWPRPGARRSSEVWEPIEEHAFPEGRRQGLAAGGSP